MLKKNTVAPRQSLVHYTIPRKRQADWPLKYMENIMLTKLLLAKSFSPLAEVTGGLHKKKRLRKPWLQLARWQMQNQISGTRCESSEAPRPHGH